MDSYRGGRAGNVRPEQGSGDRNIADLSVTKALNLCVIVNIAEHVLVDQREREKMTHSAYPSSEHLAFFDRRFGDADQLVEIGTGSSLYHGYQGDFPELTDTKPLWVTIDPEEAREYRDWGRSKDQKGGILRLATKTNLKARLARMDGVGFLQKHGPLHNSTHGFFAEKLHRWATVRGIEIIAEYETSFVVFAPKRLLDIQAKIEVLPKDQQQEGGR